MRIVTLIGIGAATALGGFVIGAPLLMAAGAGVVLAGGGMVTAANEEKSDS